MTIQHIFIKSEKCRITDDGPVVTREYRIGDDSNAMDALSFLMGPYSAWRGDGGDRLPTLGQQFSPSDEIFVSDVQAQRTGEDKEFLVDSESVMLHVWKVTVEWSPVNDLENQWHNQNIFDVQIFGDVVDLDGRYDYSNPRKANKNSVGEFFEDRLPIQGPVLVIRITEKNPVHPADATLLKKTNDTIWWGRSAGYWLCRNVQAEWVQEENSQFGWGTSGYWKNSYEFAYNPLSWTLFKADVGYYHYEGTGGDERTRNTNNDGSENIRPCLLDGAGNLLPEGSEPVLLPFKIFQSAAFPSLPMPLGWH